jgi:CheY-like chemotaxis protein
MRRTSEARGTLNNIIDLKNELNLLGMLDKAREIHSQLGDRAAISYIRSSYRLLSKIYHPDLNPENKEKAEIIQSKLNEVSETLSRTSDDYLLGLIKQKTEEDIQDKWKILIVEDEFGLQDTLRSVLTMEGYDARSAIDGISGYEIYSKFRPDLIVTDVVMPNMDGIALVRKIRKDDPKIKVIFMSGFFGIKRLKKALDDEINDHHYLTLSKPLKISILLDMIHDYLEMPS